MKIYTHTFVFRNDRMFAETFFETVRLDLILVKCLSGWKENKENPLMFVTGSCVASFFVVENIYEVSFEASLILGENVVAENHKCNHQNFIVNCI